ncbi:DEAD/DEAH box helicase [Corynebacterium sp. H113]|uniref:DEAD/DEAH box helicase n=1 Tax=Corynebacterium sp. H113 TaxID=3133419 RepID=UPI0030A8745D
MDDAIADSFISWTKSQGISLYEAQEEATLSLAGQDHVILATPTGSGKSMVAIAAHFMALARGQRSFYTAPIKALVSEKFFALCEVFGAENVGMMTGDATVNGGAPIICATAEIVANIALRDGADARIDQVVMDEFHFYAEPDRGWAWQVPLLILNKCQFLLMSATLGDVSMFQEDLKRRTGRNVELVTGSTRPVPLDFHYVYSPVHDTIDDLLSSGKAPIYVVHFSQREAVERAQALTSLKLVTPEEKERIREEIGDFRFTTTFGKVLSKLVRRGIGVHHAGMLPKYRRLVEKLSQTGLLKVICGTDTLGVGINVPIRTVLLTGLAKFDGTRMRTLKSREFHQIAGRAGRAGYDTEGTVVVQAPEHEIENVKLRRRAGQDEAKLKKLRLKAAPKGEVTWSETTFDRIVVQPPEPLTSRFQVSNGMLLNVIARGGDTFQHMKELLRGNHDTRHQQNQAILTAIELYRGLVNAGIVEVNDGRPQLTVELQRDFALNQPLSPFAIAALELLDKESDTYALDVISVFEAILGDPRPLLIAQQKKARGEEIAALKAEGVDYTERMNLVEDITWPQPLADELEAAYLTYAAGHPWVREFELSPKSVVRQMVEEGMTFSDVISEFGIARAEGVLLRYLTDAWRTLRHTLPLEASSEELDDIVTWLGELIVQVDSSLVDEWAQMADPDKPLDEKTLAEAAFGADDENRPLTGNKRAFTRMVRNLMFRHVQLFAFEKEKELAAMDAYLDDAPDWPTAMDDYFDEYDDVGIDGAARGGDMFVLDTSQADSNGVWLATQIIADPEGDHGWRFVAEIDLAASDENGEVRMRKLEVQSG